MADGTTKPISEINIGDWVIAEDPETGERGAREVTHLWVHQDTVVDLEIDGHDIATTEDHPFWNHTDNEWQRADTLDRGDLVLTADGTTLTVNGLDWTSTRTTTAYNLTIDNIHTYFVGAGDEDVLVHNQCGPNLGNMMTPSQVEDGLGMTPHELKDALDLEGPISRFDIYRHGSDVYFVEKSTGLVIETGETLG
jgi:intein/homing endonuclease